MSSDRRDAINAAIDILARATAMGNLSGLSNRQDSHTVREIAERFLKSPAISPATRKTYSTYYRCHIDAAFGQRYPGEITPNDIDDYRERRRTQRTIVGERETRPATRNREVTLLKTIISYGVKHDMAAKNPIIDVQDEPENNVRETVINETTLDKLIEHADPTLAAFILVCTDGGLRRNEACLLRWEHINPTMRVIHVSWKSAKLQKSRVTILTPRTLDAIKRLPNHGPWVFTSPKTGKPFTADYWHKSFRYLCDSRNIKGPDGNIWIHDLRRSFVTNMRRRGVPETVIMGFSGHASHDVFRRYAIVGNEDVGAALEMYEKGRVRELSEFSQEKRKRNKQK